jgi:hypothetical protein
MSTSPYQSIRKWCPIAESPLECPWFIVELDNVNCEKLTRPSLDDDKFKKGIKDELVIHDRNMLIQPKSMIQGIWHLDDTQLTTHIRYTMFSFYYPFLYQTTMEETVLKLRENLQTDADMDTDQWRKKVDKAQKTLRANPLFMMKTSAEAAWFIGNRNMKYMSKPDTFVRLYSEEYWAGSVHEMWFYSAYETYHEMEERFIELLNWLNDVIQKCDSVYVDPKNTRQIQEFCVILSDYIYSRNLFKNRVNPNKKSDIITALYKKTAMDFVDTAMLWNHEVIEIFNDPLRDGTYTVEDDFATVSLYYVTNFGLNMFYWEKPKHKERTETGLVYTMLVLDMQEIIANQFDDTFEDVCFVDTEDYSSLDYGNSPNRNPMIQGRYITIKYSMLGKERIYTMQSEDVLTYPADTTVLTRVGRNNGVPGGNTREVHQNVFYARDWKVYHCMRRCFYKGDTLRLTSPMRDTFRLRALFALNLPRRIGVVGIVNV